MLSDFEDESVLGSLDFEGIKNRRKAVFELDIDDGTDDLGDLTDLYASWSLSLISSITGSTSGGLASGLGSLVESYEMLREKKTEFTSENGLGKWSKQHPYFLIYFYIETQIYD
jgi:hypothetical protein